MNKENDLYAKVAPNEQSDVKKEILSKDDKVRYFKEIIEKYRPCNNSLAPLQTTIDDSKGDVHIFTEERRSEIYLHLREENRKAFEKLDKKYFSLSEVSALEEEEDERYNQYENESEQEVVRENGSFKV